MKNILTAILMAATITVSSAQVKELPDTVVVEHTAYTSVFANSAHIPVLVTYTLHADQVHCAEKIARSNNFKADPEVPGTSLRRDYILSGYDCGHNMSAEDNACNATAMNECFYYTNMFPQTPKLNRGVWKALETEERSLAYSYDSIVVFVGSCGVEKTIGPDHVVVPSECWKVIYIPAIHEWRAYSFPNNDLTYPFGVRDKADDDVFAAYEVPVAMQPWIKHCITHFTHYKY